MASMGLPQARGRLIGIDDVDVAIVRALEENPLASYRELGVAADLNPRSVQRRLDALTESGAVRVVASPHPQIEDSGTWFLRVSTVAGQVEEVAQWLAMIDGTRWVRASRDGQEILCGLGTPAASSQQVIDLLDSDPRIRRVIATELLTIWSQAAMMTVREPLRPLDDLDRRLIVELGRDARTDSAELAARLGVDPSTVLRRRMRLLSDRVITLVVEIDRQAFGASVEAMIFVTMAPGAIRELGARLYALPMCRFTAATSGMWSLAVEVAARDNAALLDFVDTELSDPRIRAVEIVPTGSIYKQSGLPPSLRVREDGDSAEPRLRT